MGATRVIRGWNETEMSRNILDLARMGARLPLDRTEARTPGFYLLFLEEGRGGADLGRYGWLREGARYPVYAGSAHDLRQRMRRHAGTLDGAEGIDLAQVLAVTIPTRTSAGALFGEAVALDAWRPLWNQPRLTGFGSRYPGRNRVRSQTPTAWDGLHRRQWARPGTGRRRLLARLDVATYLLNIQPGRRWAQP